MLSSLPGTLILNKVLEKCGVDGNFGRSSLVFGKETVCSEEYLFENSRPHIRCKEPKPCSLSWRFLVLALSSHVPSDPSDALEADAEAR